MKLRPGLAVVCAVVVSAVVPLALPAPAHADPVTKQDLLTLAEAETVFPELAGRHDDGNQDRFNFGMDVPAYWTSPLRCDHQRSYGGTSHATASSYSLSGPDFGFLESIVQFRTKHEARSVLQHYRDYARVCRGRHATDDGDGNAATLQVRAWRPGRVGDEAVGLLDGFTVYGRTQWRRSVVARVGRTVVLTTVEPGRGAGDPDQAVAGARLAVAKLG
ncbi:sensor domain-containing protein [Nocardioides halotolerans]|uniref:sensor domain-containing protein n=1 Tax=Nocardioides halotolerans TaxID=433660 RepID=UPI00040CC92C|nr:sensor domain-containing protein [Nocardioides halotolerans]